MDEIPGIVTGDSGNLTANSGESPEIGHVETESTVTFARNGRSRSNGMSGHVGPEYAIRDSVRNALRLAAENGYCSIALPLIGAGTGGGGGGEERVLSVMQDELRQLEFDGQVHIVRYRQDEAPR